MMQQLNIAEFNEMCAASLIQYLKDSKSISTTNQSVIINNNIKPTTIGNKTYNTDFTSIPTFSEFVDNFDNLLLYVYDNFKFYANSDKTKFYDYIASVIIAAFEDINIYCTTKYCDMYIIQLTGTFYEREIEFFINFSYAYPCKDEEEFRTLWFENGGIVFEKDDIRVL